MIENWVFIQSEPGLWTVGFYGPDKWMPESDHDNQEAAAKRVNYLNGSIAQSPQPGLGSGALREALQKWQRKYFSAGISHEMWPNAVEHAFEAGWQAALSLSSPIEPQCHELTDADAVECKNCGLGIGYWPSQPECARPTPQASSEIRERLQAILDSHPYEHEIAIEGYVRLQQQIAVVVEALARQGAGPKCT